MIVVNQRLPLLVCACLLRCSAAWADTSELDLGSTPLSTTVMDAGFTHSSTASLFAAPPSTIIPALPEPAPIDMSILPAKNGTVQFKSALDGNYFSYSQNFSNEKSSPIAIDFATHALPDTTVGWLITSKPNQTETVMNLGWRIGSNQQLLVSMAHLHGEVDTDNVSKPQTNLTQYSSGLNYRYFINKPWINGIELSSYASVSSSQYGAASIGGDETIFRIAGSNIVGMRLGLESTPLTDSKLKVGVGTERVSYDLFSGPEASASLNTSIKWSQVFLPTLSYNASIENNASQRKLMTGFDLKLRDGQSLGVKLQRTEMTEWSSSDTAINLAYTYQFGSKFKPFQSQATKASWDSSLIPEVITRPGFLPNVVKAKPDSSFN